MEARWAEGREDRLPDLAAELVRLQVHVIVTMAGDYRDACFQAGHTHDSDWDMRWLYSV